jgi:transcriptional regulator with XRE-family HTH domain
MPDGSHHFPLYQALVKENMNPVELAQRIRKHRLNRQFTLEDAATRSGLTRSWLSKVENFRITPSLPALGQIASALSVTVAERVQGLDKKPTLTKVANDERKVVEREKSKTNTTVYESLAHKSPDRSMDPFLLTVPADRSTRRGMRRRIVTRRGRVPDGSTGYHQLRVRRRNPSTSQGRLSLFRKSRSASHHQSKKARGHCSVRPL